MKALLEIDPQNLKSLRESLCVAQSAITHYTGVRDEYVAGHLKRIGAVINEIDKNRPLGSNGKHGKLHTATCGCDDNDKKRDIIEQVKGITNP